MSYLEQLRENYKIKRDECNDEQKEFFDVFLNDDYCFLRVKMVKALQIISFLGIPDENVKDFYMKMYIEMIKDSHSKRQNKD